MCRWGVKLDDAAGMRDIRQGMLQHALRDCSGCGLLTWCTACQGCVVCVYVLRARARRPLAPGLQGFSGRIPAQLSARIPARVEQTSMNKKHT